jgi:hypothetical protein
MFKTIQIEVCDCCHQEAEQLIPFVIPWPQEIIAYGGRHKQPILYFAEEPFCKDIVLCWPCAARFAKFLAEASVPEGVAISWNSKSN